MLESSTKTLLDFHLLVYDKKKPLGFYDYLGKKGTKLDRELSLFESVKNDVPIGEMLLCNTNERIFLYSLGGSFFINQDKQYLDVVIDGRERLFVLFESLSVGYDFEQEKFLSVRKNLEESIPYREFDNECMIPSTKLFDSRYVLGWQRGKSSKYVEVSNFLQHQFMNFPVCVTRIFGKDETYIRKIINTKRSV